MALGEVRAADWWRVVRREIFTGVALGVMLAVVGSVRVLIWGVAGAYGKHYLLVSFTVATSLVGVVTFGTFAGASLPFVLRKFGVDPASASAPFVATLVDVTGLIIYFTIAAVILRIAIGHALLAIAIAVLKFVVARVRFGDASSIDADFFHDVFLIANEVRDH